MSLAGTGSERPYTFGAQIFTQARSPRVGLPCQERSEPCIFCGQTGPLADPTWDGPRVHLTCVLKAQPKPEYQRELMLYVSTGRTPSPGAGYHRIYNMAYSKGVEAGRKEARGPTQA